MKKIVTIAILLISCFTMAMAQQSEAKIKFDKVSHDFGTFSENAPVQECVFSFINEGSAPLIINQAFASCGCTIPAYTKAPVMPGKRDRLKSPIMVRVSSLVTSRRLSPFVQTEIQK